ncbi:MAG: DEAD/DEAH box helicase [Candidatus Nezhaarchaeales archaeon]
MTYAIELEPVCVELGNIRMRGKAELTLRRFQEETIDFFNSPHQYLFLTAPTGSGKTFTLLTPLLSNILYGTSYDGALGIYPTKPLTVDQFESLKATLGKLSASEARELGQGVAVHDLEFEVLRNDGKVKYYKNKVGMVLLTRDTIEKLKNALSVGSGRHVLDIMRRTMLTESVDYLITLAVPEYPYLMFSHMYRSHHDLAKLLDLTSSGEFVKRVVEKMLSSMSNEDELRQYVEKIVKRVRLLVEGRVAERELAELSSALLSPVLFFDEFHTWGFYELPTAISLVLLHRLSSLTSTRSEMYKVVFSSATPSRYVLDIVDKTAGNTAVRQVRADAVICDEGSVVKIRGKTIVELVSIKTKRAGYPAWIELDEWLPTIVGSKSQEILKHKRALVFGRRVYSVEKSAKMFNENTGVAPTVVMGLTSPSGFHGKEELVAKRASGDLYVFGNYAVELGVDLQNIFYSIISATSLGELVQRMGRSGRGGIDSKVIILIPQSYANTLITHRLKGKSTIQYSEFVNALSWVMAEESVIKKLGDGVILRSRVGKLRLYLPLSNYILLSVMRHRDKPRDLKPVLSEFMKTLQTIEIDRKFFLWLRKRVSKNPDVLVELASFRLSPSVPYVRAGSRNQIDGESSPITLLSNYEVEVDTSSGFRLVIKDVKRSKIKDVVTVGMRAPNREVLSSISESILPSRLAIELTGVVNSQLVEILKRMKVPLYVKYTRGEEPVFEVLRAYGEAIALECSGEVYAYLLLL